MNFISIDLLGSYNMPKNGAPCVYMLKDDNDVIFYVGQTKSIKSRLRSHRGKKEGFKYFYIEEVTGMTLNNREAALIAKHKPTTNQNLPTNDFYTRKSSLKKQVSLKFDDLIKSMKDDFNIGMNGNTKYVAGYKALLINSMVDDVIETIRDQLKLLEVK